MKLSNPIKNAKALVDTAVNKSKKKFLDKTLAAIKESRKHEDRADNWQRGSTTEKDGMVVPTEAWQPRYVRNTLLEKAKKKGYLPKGLDLSRYHNQLNTRE